MQSGHNKSIFDTDNFLQGLQQLTRLSFSSFKNIIDTNTKMISDAGNILSSMGITLGGLKSLSGRQTNCNCCPPCDECPPYCLLMIEHSAHAGESIIVPFAVKNTCGAPKRYKIGVRPLMNQDGQQAPSQPTLNKAEIDVQPNQSVTVLMRLDLTNGYQTGNLYQTEIVIREKEINQNICFKLKIEPFFEIPEAKPLDEKNINSTFRAGNHIIIVSLKDPE